MQIKEKTVRKFLSKKIQQLNNVVADLDNLVTEIGSDYYRVSIFGSARLKPDTDEYQEVYELAKKLAKNKVDIVTGGGPGLMEAANAGAKMVVHNPSRLACMLTYPSRYRQTGILILHIIIKSLVLALMNLCA